MPRSQKLFFQWQAIEVEQVWSKSSPALAFCFHHEHASMPSVLVPKVVSAHFAIRKHSAEIEFLFDVELRSRKLHIELMSFAVANARLTLRQQKLFIRFSLRQHVRAICLMRLSGGIMRRMRGDMRRIRSWLQCINRQFFAACLIYDLNKLNCRINPPIEEKWWCFRLGNIPFRVRSCVILNW